MRSNHLIYILFFFYLLKKKGQQNLSAIKWDKINDMKKKITESTLIIQH